MKYKLDDIDKKEGFKVPEGYFEDLPMRIQQRVDQEKSVAKSRRLPSWSLAVAASVVLIIGISWIINLQQVSAEDLLADISQEDLVAYVSQLEMDEYDLANAFPDATESIEFEDTGLFNETELEDESLDMILEEYNLDDEYLDI